MTIINKEINMCALFKAACALHKIYPAQLVKVGSRIMCCKLEHHRPAVIDGLSATAAADLAP